MRMAATATSSTLAAMAALHVGWGFGTSFPFSDRARLADSVAGTTDVPGRRECFTVAALLAGAAGLVADVIPVDGTLRRTGTVGVALVLAGRGAAGLTGNTGSIVPWTPSAHFVELDKRYYGPLCLLLAVGALLAAR